MRVGGSKGPEPLERGVELARQLEGIEPLVERFELVAFGRRQHAGGREPLIGGLGTIEHATQARPGALFAHELFDRLKDIDGQAGEVVRAGELGIGGFGGEAIIADEVTDNGAVLLLHVGAVIFRPRAAAGEDDALAGAVPIQGLVDELRAVVAVDAAQGTGRRPRSSWTAAVTRCWPLPQTRGTPQQADDRLAMH